VIHLNGDPSSLGPGTTVAGAVERLGLEPQARGVAVAVNGEVVPRGQWSARVLEDDARVEVVGAMQGG
jgi:sulfur carrier protein